MRVNPYNYKELETEAIRTESPEALAALGEWFQCYGSAYWNGECWNIDDDRRLFPIYEECDDGDFDVTGYEIR